jgi:hypothetical protein
MAGIPRVHGGVISESLISGYQMTFLKIEGTNVGTADSGGAGSAITEGNFQKAIRAIQTIATTLYIGTRANNQFVVAVDGPTAQPTGPAFDTDGTPTVAERIKIVLDAATGVTTTVTDITGLAAGTIA